MKNDTFNADLAIRVTIKLILVVFVEQYCSRTKLPILIGPRVMSYSFTLKYDEAELAENLLLITEKFAERLSANKGHLKFLLNGMKTAIFHDAYQEIFSLKKWVS